MGLFFGNKDVKTLIESAGKLSLGKLDKIIIGTNEMDIPAMALSGSSALEDLEKFVLDLELVPKLVEAVRVAIGQADNSGNKLIPSYLFIIGKKPSTTKDGTYGEDASLFEAIEAFDKSKEADFYGVALCYESINFENWSQLYAPNHLFATKVINIREILETGKSERIFAQHAKTDTQAHIAWLARGLFSEKFIGWKFKKLNGVNPEISSDGEVEALEKRGLNTYRTVRGKGQTTGSLCTDGKSHIDEIYLKDTIVYNVSNSLMDMFDNEEIVPMGFAGKKLITNYINSALTYCGTLGLIEKGEDGSYLFKVTVPDFTKEMKSLRELRSDMPLFEYSPNIPLEKVIITGKEILDWTGGAS
ncbi:MAG: hypothetical protein ACRC0F_03685 [Cetobacterium sp.]